MAGKFWSIIPTLGWEGGAQTCLAIQNCLIKEKRHFLLFYKGGIISCYLKEMLIPINAHFVLSGMLPSQQLNLKSKVNLGASLRFPAAVFWHLFAGGVFTSWILLLKIPLGLPLKNRQVFLTGLCLLLPFRKVLLICYSSTTLMCCIIAALVLLPFCWFSSVN